jgi:hypothetical protein
VLARLQQVTTIGLLLAAAAWAVFAWRVGAPGWALAGAMAIVFGYAVVLGIEFVLMHLANRRDVAPPATLRQVFRAWRGEVLAAPRVFCWRQPFRANAVPDHVDSVRGRRGVVFVHGFVCNRGLWNPLMARLRALGVPFVAINLEPVFGSIDHYADIIEEGVRRMETATGLPPVVVGHSMGGLAIRAWMAARAADSRVHRVITIGSPHRGTWLGRFGHTHNARQMRVGSPWQEQLALLEPPQRFQRFTCFYGHCDNIVFPASAATLPGADNVHLAGVAHVDMAFRTEVMDEILRWAGV